MILLHPEAKFRLSYSVDSLLPTWQPFIRDIQQGINRGLTLSDAVQRSADRHPSATRFFQIEQENIGETFGLKYELMFADRRPEKFHLSTPLGYTSVALPDSDQGIRSIATVLRAITQGVTDTRALAKNLDAEGQAFLDALVNAGATIDGAVLDRMMTEKGTCGIYRLQHASLLYRSGSHGILVDPHFHSSYRPDGIGDDIALREIIRYVDAVLISHFHEDHFFLASLLMLPRDMLIIVPRVPRSSIICEDMANLLGRCGFTNVQAVDWFAAPVKVGSMEVSVLPFYGEQPLRYDQPKFAAVRNWGNTYLVKTPAFTSWFLIDSGADASGSMGELAHRVHAMHGDVDIVLSNLRRFGVLDPFYINHGYNWLSLSPRQIEEFQSMAGHCLTLGPEGVAEVCKVVRAKYYLPYAHWWGQLGHHAESGVDTPGQEEYNLVFELGRKLHSRGMATRIIPWGIGDGFVARPKMEHVRFTRK